jgi:hypothetical protein
MDVSRKLRERLRGGGCGERRHRQGSIATVTNTIRS